MKANRKITHGEKKLFFITGLAVIFLIAFGAWRQWVNAIPEVKIPTVKLPSPNAYDFYVKAGAAIVRANPAVDPAYDAQTVPESQWKVRYPTAAKEAWLLKNAMSLKLLRQGFRYPCHLPPQRSSNLNNFNSFSKFREMARMLSVENRVRSEQGSWDKAAESTLDILRLGQDIQ